MTATIEISPDLAAWSLTSDIKPVEAGSIERFADSLQCQNPLYRDAAFAQAHGFRAQVAPPTFVDNFKPLYENEAYPYVPDGLPFSLSAADSYEFLAPVCAGDVLAAETRLTGISRRTRADGSPIEFVEYVNLFRNLAGVVVVRETWTGAYFDGSPTANRPAVVPPAVPGSFDIPAPTIHTTRVSLARWAGAVGDWQRIHIDEPYATNVMNLPSVVGHGTRTTALAARALTDWCGPDGTLRSLSVQYRGVSLPGEQLWARASLVALGNDGPVGTYRAAVAVVDQDERVLTLGTAIVDRPHEVPPAGVCEANGGQAL